MLAGILVIILLTTKSRLPAFFAMLIACLVTGLGIQLSIPELVTISKAGFGNTMQSLGFLIVLGTLLGLLLEHTGSTRVMAEYILKKAGQKNASLALGITGFIVGLPVFCDFSASLMAAFLPFAFDKAKVRLRAAIGEYSICNNRL